MIQIDVTDFQGWRKTARELLKRGITPDEISWGSTHAKQTGLNFDESPQPSSSQSYLLNPIKQPDIKIAKQFFELAKNVACFRSDRRWHLLYSVAYRSVFENPRLLGNSIDHQVSELLMMQKAVSRDRHKMKAFVRFKSVDINTNKPNVGSEKQIFNADLAEYFIAWFEPDHLILPITASFFVKRFTNMNWSIFTPDLCAHWNGDQLEYSAGIETKIQQSDQLEELWLEYYKNIFNPARLKINAMQSEMPKKYWRNLPEAALIDDLTRNAKTRTKIMLEQNYPKSQSKLSKSSYIKQQQDKLRRPR